MFEPRNPPYYPGLFEQCGFSPVHHWSTYELDSPTAARRLEQFEKMLRRRPAPPIEELSPAQAEETIQRIHRLLDACWGGHLGYAPLDLDEFAEVFHGALSIMDPGGVSVLVQDGRDSGYTLTYSDYADEMRSLGGHVAGWGKWMNGPRPKRIVLHTAALTPEARNTSAVLAQVASTFRQGVARGFDNLIVALAIDGFLGRIGERTREYAMYARSLSADA
jgi:hypothetical protein